MELSERIRILRKAKGLSQQGLGDLLSTGEYGVSRQAVSEWETGNSIPKVENIKEIARVLDVSLEDLLDDNINLNNNETLLAVLHHDYKKGVDSSFYTHYPIERSFAFVLVIIFLLFAVASVYFVIWIFKVQPSSESPKTIVDKLDVLKKNIDSLYPALYSLAAAVPLVFGFGVLISKLPVIQRVGFVSPRCLLLNHSSRYIPINGIKKISHCFLITKIELRDGEKIRLFFIKNHKGLINVFNEISSNNK